MTDNSSQNNLGNSSIFDLNFYFNAKNIPNQELVFETYNYFLSGDGRAYFEPLDFLNLLFWHYKFLNENVEKPFDVLNQFRSAQFAISELQRHLLLGFILKWFGGYPVNNLNSQYNTTLKLIEMEYLRDREEKINRFEELSTIELAGGLLSHDEKKEHIELRAHCAFLFSFNKIVSNSISQNELRKNLKTPETSIDNLNEENFESKSTGLYVFVSHSSKDAQLVKLFTDKILQLSLRISLENIFCTSIESTSIATGEDFRQIIKNELIKASHVIQIITLNYKSSEVCLNEMGAAWVLSNKVIPFIFPPVNYKSVGFIHEPNQMLRLNDKKDLLKFIDEMKSPGVSLSHTEVNRHIADFIESSSQFYNN